MSNATQLGNAAAAAAKSMTVAQLKIERDRAKRLGLQTNGETRDGYRAEASAFENELSTRTAREMMKQQLILKKLRTNYRVLEVVDSPVQCNNVSTAVPGQILQAGHVDLLHQHGLRGRLHIQINGEHTNPEPVPVTTATPDLGPQESITVPNYSVNGAHCPVCYG